MNDGRKVCAILPFTTLCLEHCRPTQSIFLTGNNIQANVVHKILQLFSTFFSANFQTAVDALHRREAQLALKEYENAHSISEPASEFYERNFSSAIKL